MQLAILAMKKAFIYYLVRIITLILLGIGWTVIAKQRKHSTHQDGMLLLLLCIAIVIYTVVNFVPFAAEYGAQSIIETEGIYTSVAQPKGTANSIVGIYSVTLDTDSGKLNLSTAPFKKDLFVEGSCYVKAFYLPRSKTLLHMEVIDAPVQ